MPTPSELFRQIHRLRVHSRELQTEIDRAPVQLKARQNFAAKQAKLAQEGRDKLKKLKLTVHESESDLKSAHEQLQKYRRQLNDVTDQKQFEALKHEISDAESRCAKMEESILTGLGEIDEQTAQVPLLDAAAAKAKSDLDSFDAETKIKHTQLADELKKTLGELKAYEKEIPADVQPEYVRRVASYGADALASAGAGVCSQCNTTISAQMLINLTMGQFVTCTLCYRFLYLPE
jgi:uncharacterized protein